MTKKGVPDRGVSTGKATKPPARRRLTYQPLVEKWSAEEDNALTQFVLLSCGGDSWPVSNTTRLWEGASRFLRDNSKTARTSKA